jgi:hypothetical protein
VTSPPVIEWAPELALFEDEAPPLEPELQPLEPEEDPDHGGDPDAWPHTNRVLPWMVAGFIAMLWLVPFNTILLNGGGPVDLQLDRLVLPVIAGVWVLTLAVGGRAAPRLRLSGVHVGVGLFILVACLSVVVQAGQLNRSLELGMSIKKLTLLFNYGLFFVIVASSIRPQEVRAFLKLTLILSVICSLGTILEYRLHYNVFYDLTAKFLRGGLFSVQHYHLAVDEIGRPLIMGPTEHPLEVATILAMALPIAVVGMMQARRPRDRILNGLAVCIIMAAEVSTYRKTSIIAPVGAIMTLVAFRPRFLVKLAPVFVVLIVIIHALSPGALGAVVAELQPKHFNSVSTVNDRKDDYDALHPDVFTHPLLGKGFGSYDHRTYRVLDSQMLGLAAEVGAIGLLAYCGIFLSIVGVARGPIKRRDPRMGTAALATAAAAIAFLIASFLFDSMGFPHGPYVLLSLAGILVAGLTSYEVKPQCASSS